MLTREQLDEIFVLVRDIQMAMNFVEQAKEELLLVGFSDGERVMMPPIPSGKMAQIEAKLATLVEQLKASVVKL